MRRFLLGLVFLTAAAVSGNTQPSLGIGSVIYIQFDTISYNQQDSVAFLIENTGDSLYEGSIKVQYMVNDSFYGDFDSIPQVVNLSPNSTFQFESSHLIDPTVYALGDNIVVIWPVAGVPGVSTSDSSRFHLFVQEPTGQGDIGFGHEISVWQVNGQYLLIDYGEALPAINSLALFDLPGHRLWTADQPVETISLENLPSAIYLLVIRGREGALSAYKVWKY